MMEDPLLPNNLKYDLDASYTVMGHQLHEHNCQSTSELISSYFLVVDKIRSTASIVVQFGIQLNSLTELGLCLRLHKTK
jgi:hypothetical protein